MDVRSDDVAELGARMWPWARTLVQTDPGPFSVDLSSTGLGPVSLLWKRVGAGIAAAGTPPARTLSFAVVIAAPRPPRFCGRPVLRGEVAVACPDQEWHGRWPAGLALFAAVVDVDALAACAKRMQMPDPSARLRENAVLAAPGLEAMLLHLNERALRDRAALHRPGARRMLAAEILVRIVEGLAQVPDPAVHVPSSPTRSVALTRALAHLRGAEPAWPTVPELSRAARVSARTLEYAFRERFGVTPVHFLKLRRLHAAQAALRRASRGETVSGVALRYGFGDFGHFARDYRALFGQRPSEILRGSALRRPRLVSGAANSP